MVRNQSGERHRGGAVSHSDARTTCETYGHHVGDGHRDVEKVSSVLDAIGCRPLTVTGNFLSEKTLQVTNFSSKPRLTGFRQYRVFALFSALALFVPAV